MEIPVSVIIIHDRGLTLCPPGHCVVGSGFACCLVKHMARVVLKCRMGESGLVIRLAHAQSSVITEDREHGFSKTGPIF